MDITAVKTDDFLRYCKPESGTRVAARHGCIDLYELIENVLMVILGYPATRVAHDDPQVFFVLLRRDVYPTVFGEFDGIADHIDQRLSKPLGVRDNRQAGHVACQG